MQDYLIEFIHPQIVNSVAYRARERRFVWKELADLLIKCGGAVLIETPITDNANLIDE